MDKLGYLDSLVLDGFEKVVQYAAKHDLSKYDLMKTTEKTFGATEVAFAAAGAAYYFTTYESSTFGEKLCIGVFATLLGLSGYNRLRNRSKELAQNELKKYEESQRENKTESESTKTRVLEKKNPGESFGHFFWNCFGMSALAYIFSTDVTTPAAAVEDHALRAYLSILVAKNVVQDYLPDTSFILSPKKQAKLEAKLQEKQAQGTL